MFFDLTDDQLAMQAAMRQFCEERVPMSLVSSLAPSGGFVASLWRDLADMGLFSLRLPPERGGADVGLADSAIVFEELGRAAVPGPAISTHLAVTSIPEFADGLAIVGDVDISSGWPASKERPILLEHFDALGAVVMVSEDGLRRFARDQIEVAPVTRPLDPLTPVHRVVELGDSESIGGSDAARRWRLEGATLTAAFQVGLATAALDQAVAYAKERQQFHRPIGSFQAVKHQLADSLVRADVARATVYAAAVTLDSPGESDPARAVAAAKILADEAAIKNAKTAIQVNGAMGFSWEVELHYYLKRAWVLSTHYGSGDSHAEVMVTSL